jgi:hypothetical protein
MALIAVDENTELGLCAQMYKELAQYMAPKRKAVEVTGKLDQSFIDTIRRRARARY